MSQSRANAPSTLRQTQGLTHDPVHGPASRPVTFEGTVGLFTPARGPAARMAVLFLSPWGLEELCVRKAWRQLADTLSVSGIASLRFDHPATGDALDEVAGEGLTPFTHTAMAAAVLLAQLSGVSLLVLVAQGFGALLVPQMLEQFAGMAIQADGVALLGPVTSGRRYLRELSLWSKMVDEGLGLPVGSAGPGVSIAGLRMNEPLAAAVRGFDAKAFRPMAPVRWLIAERAQTDMDAALSVHLEAAGAEVTRVPFDGYADLVSNPTIAEPPLAVFETLTGWIGASAGPDRADAPTVVSTPGLLHGPGFTERPMRFGSGDRLYGTVCEPAGSRPVGTVLLLGTGYDRQSGWARSAVETARALSASGIASLRFDAANIADSPPVPGGEGQVLYSSRQIDDVRAALDLIDVLNLPQAVFVGRCSGAYLAFNAALKDPRCRGVIAVNILTFAWDPRDDVDQMVRYNPRSLDDYTRRAFRMETAVRLLSGQVDLPRAASNMLKMAARRLSQTASPVLGSLSVDARLRNEVHRAFRNLHQRNVPVSLVYSAGDIGLARLGQHFGRDGALLSRFPNVSRFTLADADHNVTPEAARRQLREHIRSTVLAMAGRQQTKVS